MQTKIVSGVPATDRAGAAEYLDMPINTVRMYSSPSRRRQSGFPEPLPLRPDGRDWFALTALAAYNQRRNATTPSAPAGGDPDELIDRATFARLRAVTPATMNSYVKLSLAAWQQGQDGYLPLPDRTQPARNGNSYWWKRSRATAWAFPTTPRRSTGRPPAAHTATVADLNAVLQATAGQLTNRDIAAALSERLGTPVSIQTVQRLRRKQRHTRTPGPADPPER